MSPEKIRAGAPRAQVEHDGFTEGKGPGDKYLTELERRLNAYSPLSKPVFVSGTGGTDSGAQMYWEDPNSNPRILWTPDLVKKLSAVEFDALCAHEHRHLAGWWGCQERCAFKDGEEPQRWDRRFVFAEKRWCFEFQGDAFAARFTSVRDTRTMLEKVRCWASANPAPASRHRGNPHPPYGLRIALLGVTRLFIY
jgi:hypothetical protein